jgi:hypothetical protein
VHTLGVVAGVVGAAVVGSGAGGAVAVGSAVGGAVVGVEFAGAAFAAFAGVVAAVPPTFAACLTTQPFSNGLQQGSPSRSPHSVQVVTTEQSTTLQPIMKQQAGASPWPHSAHRSTLQSKTLAAAGAGVVR